MELTVCASVVVVNSRGCGTEHQLDVCDNGSIFLTFSSLCCVYPVTTIDPRQKRETDLRFQ